MKTKTKMNRTKDCAISIVSLLVVASLLTGWLITRKEYLKKINDVQNNLATVQNELIECKKNLKATQSELEQSQANYQFEQEKVLQLTDNLASINNELETVKSELEDANGTISDLKNSEYKLVYMGDFKLTHYCPGYHGEPCGTGDGITATGTKVVEGRTIAADPNVVPYGTKVYIEGYGWRTAEDCGGGVKGNHIDIAVSDHSSAMSMGVKNGGVWILVKNS